MSRYHRDDQAKSSPPSYSAFDPAAGSSRGPPPPYNPNTAATTARNERTPLIIRQHTIIRQTSRIIVSTSRVKLPGVGTLLKLVAIAFFAYAVWNLVTWWYLLPHNSTLHNYLPTYNIAIIGAGPAGIAAAQYLLHSSASQGIHFNITIFESKSMIGGMLSLQDETGSPVYPNYDLMQSYITAEDIVGTALMWQNSLFTQDSEKILGDSVGFEELSTDKVGYYENKNGIASAIRPYAKSPWTTWVSLLWTYGSSLYRAAQFNIEANLRDRMPKAPVTVDTEEIFRSLKVLEPLQEWARNHLNKSGISDKYATEILEPQTRRALGHVTGFGAMLAAWQEDSANAYTGGHMLERLEQVVRKLRVSVRKSTRVVGLRNDWEGNQWSVQHESANGGGHKTIEVFDKVILAALDFSIRLVDGYGRLYNLTSFQNPSLTDGPGGPEDDFFVPVHVTFFTTNTKLTTWGDHDQVLFIDGTGDVEEIAFVRETTSHMETQYLYRVLSGSSVLDYLKNNYGILWSYETKISNWHPFRYPLEHMPVLQYPPARGLWWTSTIQQAWSTVDLNWLAGKAVADDLIKEILAGK
ncbi:hypothetical protein F5Y08DRAFT_79407 [Xylaria arbuscula]|nr:hypothetical protein F5Y08DRAFT_79407 [Xylaria arbuscula]